MKKTFLLLLLLFTFATSFSQPCLQVGIVFNSQAEINNFQVNFPNCTGIEGDVTISGNDITNLIGLSMLTFFGGDLIVENNISLGSFTGLENVSSIGGDLIINGNNILTSFAGLNNVSSIGGDIVIWGNNGLNNLSGLEGINSINGSLYVGLLAQTGNNSLTNLNGLNNISSISGGLYVESNDVMGGLSGLDNLQDIGGGLYIQDNHALTGLNGLENLSSIGGALFISFNDVLNSLEGLLNVNSIGADLVILNNQSLVDLGGLNSLSTIWGNLNIDGNSSLTSLNALENLSSIGINLMIIDNPNLSSLAGLDNIAAGSIEDLFIHHNYSLSECAIQSICDYINDPNGELLIEYNATGCYNQEEVKDACGAVSVEELVSDIDISVRPNPCSDVVRIRYRMQDPSTTLGTGSGYQVIELFSISGMKVKEFSHEVQCPGEYELVVDVSNLPAGVYYIQMQAGGVVSTQKLVISR